MTEQEHDATMLAEARNVRAEAMHPDAVRVAVADGIRLAVSDPAMWASAMRAMQSHAQAEAGGWLLGGIRAVVSKISWFVVIGGGIYLMGGWGALVAFIKSGGGQH